jgi:hypothetical protein
MIDAPRTRRLSDPFFALFGVRIVIWLWVVRTVVPALFLDPWKLGTYHDEHYHYAHDDAARLTVSWFHQIPSWNPYYCGGVPGVGNPQGATFSPEFLLKLIFETGPGRRLGYLMLFVLGMEGVYRLARRLDASAIGAILAGATFATCGFFANVMRLGWLNFFTFQLVAWVALAYLEGLKSWAWRIGGGLFVGWMVLAGGVYTVPYTVLLLGLMVMLTMGELLLGEPREDRPHWTAPLITFAAIGVVSACVSAFKLLPMMRVIVDHPRLWEGGEAYPVSDIIARLIGPVPFEGQPGLIGKFMFALAFLAAAFDKNGARAFAFSVVFFCLALGDYAEWAPNAKLHALPVFAQLRFPHRFVVMVAMFVCIGAGIAIGRLEDLFVAIGRVLRNGLVLRPIGDLSPTQKLAFGAVGALLSLKLSLFVWDDYAKEAMINDSIWVMDSPRVRHAEFRQSRGNRWDGQVWAQASLGTLQCFEETEFPISSFLTGDAPAEEMPLDPSVATVQRLRWTPNGIKLHVKAQVPTTVIVNQNWHRAWKSSVGQTYSRNGLLAVSVPNGEYDLVIRYRDRLVGVGLGISVASLLVILGLAIREGLRQLRAFRAWWAATRW